MHKKLGVWIFAGVIGVINLAFASAPDTLWTRTFGREDSIDYGYSVQQTKDSGFVVAGYTKSFGAGEQDVYLIKTNSSGDTVWTRTFGGTNDDEGHSVQQTTDGGYIVVGGTASYGIGEWWDVYIVKTDSLGDKLWTKTYGGSEADLGYSVQQTTDGGFIISGYTLSFGAGNSDIYLIRTDSSGDTLWTRTFGGAGSDYGESVQQTTDGGFVIVGYKTDPYKVYLIKTDSSGDTLWTKTLGGTNEDLGESIQQTTDGGYIITGETYSFGTGIPNYSNLYLIRTNSSGTPIWSKAFGGTNHEGGYSVRQTKDGGFIVAGYTGDFSIIGDVYLVRTNSSGDTLWTKTVGGTKWDGAFSVQQTSDGGFIIAGEAAGATHFLGTDSGNVYLIRLKSETGIEENLDFGFGNAELKIGQTPITSFANIFYTIPSQCKLELNVYDITGSCVKTLVNGQKQTGTYTTTLNAKKLKAGVYFLVLNANGVKTTKKLTIIK